MLTISNIKSSSKTTGYFCMDDYYVQNSMEHQNLSSWYGKGAKELNLSGNVKKEDFKRILDGKITKDITLGVKKEDDSLDHFPGIDMTFAPPKSVSIASELLGNDKEIREAHEKSVNKILDIVEKDYVSTRVKKSGKVTKETTDNLVIAKFLHNTNRNLEPHLHTHCIVANAVKKENGDWRSAWFKDIFNNKLNLGALYRSELAHNLTKLGYSLEQKSGIANFEIKGIPQSLIKSFSSRREEILKKIEELGQKDAKAKQMANLLTRSKKTTIAHDQLKQYWKNELANKLSELNINKETLSKKNLVKQGALNSSINQENAIKSSVDFAISHLCQRRTIFEKIELEKIALNDSLGKSNIDQIKAEIGKRIEFTELLEGKTNRHKNTLTTKSSLKLEKETLAISKEGRNKFASIINTEKPIDNFLPVNLDFNQGQKNAIEAILTSKDQLIAIQGYAGTGKTYMLKAVNKIAQENNYELVGLAPTGVATRNLQEEANINSSTLQKFLSPSRNGGYEGVARGRGTKEGREKMKEEFKNKVIIVDEASMIGTNQMKDLLTISKELNFRIVLIGDIKQLDSVESGIPFYELQKNGVRTTIIKDIVRQNNQNIKSAVYDMIDRKIDSAFKNLDSNIVEITKKTAEDGDSINPETNEEFNKRIQKIVADKFIALSKKDRDNTMILTPANDAKDGINNIISQELFLERKEKGKNAKEFNIYKNKNLTEAEKSKAYSYDRGNVILMSKDTSEFKKNEYYEVVDKNGDSNILLLRKVDESLLGKIKRNLNSNIIQFNPAKFEDKNSKIPFEVFNGNITRIFKRGDKISFNRSINHLGIINSDQGQINKITNKKISINLQNKKDQIILDKNTFDSKHIDLNYATTSHKAQGLSVNNIIALTESWRGNLTSQKNFYVQISRAKDDITIITDSKENTIEQLKKNTGIDISAREHQEAPNYFEKIMASQKNQEKQLQFLVPYQKQQQAKNPTKNYQDVTKIKAAKEKPTQGKRGTTSKAKYYIPNLSEREIKENFIQAASDKGLIDNADIKRAVDKAFTNIGTKIWCGEKKGKTNIEIRWFGNAGYIKNFKMPDEVLKWGINSIKSDKIQYKELSLDEINQRSKEEKLRQQKTKMQEKLKHEAGSEKANRNFNYYKEQNKDLAKKHKYLVDKGIAFATGIRGIKITTDNRIVIPIKDLNGNIASLQYINEDGKKYLLRDGTVHGNFFVIGDIDQKDNHLIIAEGFSTAATIHKATNKPVIIAFSASNIENVIKNLNTKYKDKEFIIAGDNDIHKERNTGKTTANKIAGKFHNVKALLPEFSTKHQEYKPSDFNDLAKLEGIKEVSRQFNGFMQQNYSYKSIYDIDKSQLRR